MWLADTITKKPNFLQFFLLFEYGTNYLQTYRAKMRKFWGLKRLNGAQKERAAKLTSY